MKSKLILGILIQLIIMTSAYANSSCEDLYSTICKDQKNYYLKTDILVRNTMSKIYYKAKSESDKKIIEIEKKYNLFNFRKKNIEIEKIKSFEIEKVTSEVVSNLEKDISNKENILNAKKAILNVLETIDFEKEVKEKIKLIIEKVQVGNYFDFIKKANEFNGPSLQKEAVKVSCGSYGLKNSAFSMPLAGVNYVLLCPGFFLSLEENLNENERKTAFIHALVHEMTHFIDSEYIKSKIYERFLNCIKNNYHSLLNKNLNEKSNCTQDDCRQKLVIAHAREMIADQWGIMVSGELFNRLGLNPEESLLAYQRNWIRWCSGVDEGTHPNTEFRLNVLLKLNPKTEVQLGCAPEKTQMSCSFF